LIIFILDNMHPHVEGILHGLRLILTSKFYLDTDLDI